MKEQFTILLVFCVVVGTLSKPPPTFLEYKDSLGQYSFGYSAPGSARSEVRTLDGSTRGSYSYVDDAGVIQSAQYTADGENGFRVVATNLPQAPNPVADTPEVVAARLDHFKAHELAAESIEKISNEKIQPKTTIDEKTSVAIENNENSVRDATDGQVHGKSGNLEALVEAKAESSMKAQDGSSDMDNEAVDNAKKNLSPMMIVEKTAEIEPGPVASQSKSAVRSDIPVVTTSFVIPGTVDLHTRIELDHYGASAVRSSLESTDRPISQPSKPQGSDIDPSTITPASTELRTNISDDEKDGISIKTLPLPVSPVQTTLTHYIPQPFSVPFVPGVIASSNIIAVPYAVGRSHIYPHYNPYGYFPFGYLQK